MIDLSLHNIKGEEIGEVSLNDAIFNTKINKYLVHQVIKRHLATKRRGTASTKNRSEVSGGGAKPWKQKGTGRARAGSNRSPIWVGGGTVFGPTPRNFSFSLPQKMKIASLKSALSNKVKNKEIIVLDKFTLDKKKTKTMVEILTNLKAYRKPLIILEKEDKDIQRAIRNIQGAMVLPVSKVNTFDLVNQKMIIITESALKKIEEVLV